MKLLNSQGAVFHPIHSTSRGMLVAVYFCCVLLITAVGPTTASALPVPATLVKISCFDDSLKQCTYAAKVTFTPTRNVMAYLRVTTLGGVLVREYTPVSVAKDSKKTLIWNGRAGWSNKLGLATGDLVQPGSYRVTLVVKNGVTSYQNVVNAVKVSSSGRQTIKQVEAPSSLYLSPSGTPGMYRAIIKLRKKSDVLFEVVHPATGAVLVHKMYRDQPSGRNLNLSWNGRFTTSNAMRVASGEFSQAGSILPLGTYLVRMTSNNVKSFKRITIRPAPKLAWESRIDSWAFPLNYKNEQRTNGFGTRRSGGRRHAGIDLLAPSGTVVYAMSDGVVEEVIRGKFYAGTGAIQVRHSDGIVIRYCEIRPGSTFTVGSTVRKNQRIGAVQRSWAGGSMLHLEAYAGTASGTLTRRSTSIAYRYIPSRSYMRRSDLFNPSGIFLLGVPSGR